MWSWDGGSLNDISVYGNTVYTDASTAFRSQSGGKNIDNANIFDNIFVSTTKNIGEFLPISGTLHLARMMNEHEKHCP